MKFRPIWSKAKAYMGALKYSFLTGESPETFMGDEGGQMAQIPVYVVVLGVGAIAAGLVVRVLANMKATSGDADANTTYSSGITAAKELASWLDDIAMIIAAVIILGLLGALYGFTNKYRSRGGQ